MPFSVDTAIPHSEDEILACIARFFPDLNASVLLGRGDDCALLSGERPMCVSSDLFLEDVHFRNSYFMPEEVGYKALGVNLSDLAACGARPVGFTLSLGIPPNTEFSWLEAFFSGMASLADRHGVSLVGGDLSRAPAIHISITAFGEVSGVSCFPPRGGSMPGDSLFLIGQIGLSYVGLRVLERFGRAAREEWPCACSQHLTPIVHCAAGQVLARAGFNVRPPALMDVSDGMIRDLPRLLGIRGELGISEGSIGCSLTINESMLHPEVLRWSHEQHRNPVETALLGGEDYALVGTCAPDLLPTFQAAIPEFSVLGTVTSNGKLVCNGQELPLGDGFDHFSPDTSAH